MWQWGDLWPSYLVELAHRDELLLVEHEPRVAAALSVSGTVVGDRVYAVPRDRPPTLGQLRLL